MFITCPAAIHQHNGRTKESRETCSYFANPARPDYDLFCESVAFIYLYYVEVQKSQEVPKSRTPVQNMALDIVC